MRLAAALLLALFVAPAAAQPAETVLRLAETAEVTRPPDELRAMLRAEARAATVAAAQEQVNRAIAAALEEARAVPGLRATTTRYHTMRGPEGRGWVASQTLTLRGEEFGPLLQLVGVLQQAGLGLADLTWSLTEASETAARDEATRKALDGLRRRAAEAAAHLGMVVAGLREVRLDAPRNGPQPRARMASASSSGSRYAAPLSEPEDVQVPVTAEAEVVLRPR